MITIIRGNEKIVCTQKTYEEQYKDLGYQIASKEKEAAQKVASVSVKEEIKEDVVKEEKEEKEKKAINQKYGIKSKKGK